jgi:hypothetical protein
MIDVLIAAAVVAVLLGWVSQTRVRKRAQWRVAAGFLPIALLAAAGFAAVRGDWPITLALGAAAASLALLARWPGARPAESATVAMSLDDARAMLGVDTSASEAEIQAAYLRLMRRVHPDHGGASGLAAQLNLARDRLLGR